MQPPGEKIRRGFYPDGLAGRFEPRLPQHYQPRSAPAGLHGCDCIGHCRNDGRSRRHRANKGLRNCCFGTAYSLTCIARSQKQSGQFQILLHSGMHGFRAMLYQAMHWAWRFDRSSSSLTSVRSVLVADTHGGGHRGRPIRLFLRNPRSRRLDPISRPLT
jgi:hypothetical protein